jgi:hypothetical protein
MDAEIVFEISADDLLAGNYGAGIYPDETAAIGRTDSDAGFACIVSESGDVYWRLGNDSCAALMELHGFRDDGSYVGLHVVSDNGEKYPYLYPDGHWKMLAYNADIPDWFTGGMKAAAWSAFAEWKAAVYGTEAVPGILDYNGLLALSAADTLSASPAAATDGDVAAFVSFIRDVNALVTFMRNSVTMTLENSVGPAVSNDAYNYGIKEATDIAKNSGGASSELPSDVSNVGVIQSNFYAAVVGSFFDVPAGDWVYYAGAADGYPYASAKYLWDRGMYASQSSDGTWRLRAANGGKVLYAVHDDEVSVKNAFAAVVAEDGTVYWKSGLDNVDLVKAYYRLDGGSEYAEVQVKPVLDADTASFTLPDGNNTSAIRVFPYLDENSAWTAYILNGGAPAWYGPAHEAALLAARAAWKEDVYGGFDFEAALGSFPESTRQVAEYADEDVELLAEWASVWHNISDKGVDPTAAIILSGYKRVGNNLWDDFDAYLLSAWRAVHSECPGSVVIEGYFRALGLEEKDWDSKLKNTVGNSVSDVMEALAGYYFSNISEWEYYDGDAAGYPYASGAALVLKNLVPYTDGVSWYLASGEDAEIVFEIPAADLLAGNYGNGKSSLDLLVGADGAVTASARLDAGGYANAVIVVALYDRGGGLLALNSKTVPAADGGLAGLSASVSIGHNADAAAAKAFVWDAATFAPLAGAAYAKLGD